SCRDGDVGCDADGTPDGTCRFTVAACLARSDARFATCVSPAISAWSIIGKVDPAAVGELIASVAALGPSTVDGVSVTFSPALAEAGCAADVPLAVPAGSRLVLKSRTTGPDGKPKD